MNWIYRSLLFLGIALLFTAGFLGLNQLGAFKSYEMTGFPGGAPPGQTQTATATSTVKSAESSSQSEPTAVEATGTATASASTSAAPAGSAPQEGEVQGGPPGGRKGGFNWRELGKDTALVLGAWLALSFFDWFTHRTRPHTSAQS